MPLFGPPILNTETRRDKKKAHFYSANVPRANGVSLVKTGWWWRL
jgi:hypothetical protein